MFWIWPLILGLFLIILSGLLAGGLHETNSWIWTAFIVGAILVLIGAVLAIIAWTKEIRVLRMNNGLNGSNGPVTNSVSTPSVNNFGLDNLDLDDPGYANMNSLIAPSPTPLVDPIRVSPNNSVVLKEQTEPIDYNNYRYASPIGTPSKTVINLPQAQRGFSASNLQISSLAPEL